MLIHLASIGNVALFVPGMLVQLLVAVGIFIALTTLYRRFHRFPFLTHVGNRNTAAAIAYGSIQIGFAIPLVACLGSGRGPLYLILWAPPIWLIQYMCFLAGDAVFTGVPGRIANNDIAVAIMMGASRISVALIIAGAVIH